MDIEDKKREVGYKIDEINEIKNANQFEVHVIHPDMDGTRERFLFRNNENWNSKREYVDESTGEVKEDYNWKIHIEKQMKNRYEDKTGKEEVDFDKSEFEGKKLDV